MDVSESTLGRESLRLQSVSSKSPSRQRWTTLTVQSSPQACHTMCSLNSVLFRVLTLLPLPLLSPRSYRGVPNPPPFPSPLNSTTQSQHTGLASGNTLAGRLPDHPLADPLPRSEGHYMARFEHTPKKADASARRFDKRVEFYESAAALYELPAKTREYRDWVEGGRHRQDDPRERNGRKIHSEGPTELTSGSGGHPDTGYLNWEQAGRLREGMTMDDGGRHSREWAQSQAAYAACDPNFVSAPSSFMQATSSSVSIHRPPSPGDEMDMPYSSIPHGYSQNHPWEQQQDDGYGAAGARPSRAASLAVPSMSARTSRHNNESRRGSSSRSGQASRVRDVQGRSLHHQAQSPSHGQSSHHSSHRGQSSRGRRHHSSNHRRRNRSDGTCCDVM
ncbi:hypothetical protein BD289DRAFT_231072 [Coniella lustricola]|uniref:Uncharacterized protein n=1 Tax=Coniella lustricola TaxID=2025994 RepID=A0A2T2ZRW4_9PEZI|nr:hypothetical protein BD289DRAFT_231072 [Coniella lustricola]